MNSTVPHSDLKKKSCSIPYHYIREGVANDEWRIAFIKSDSNRSDLLSKHLPCGSKREQLIGMILHHVYTRIKVIVEIIGLHRTPLNMIF